MRDFLKRAFIVAAASAAAALPMAGCGSDDGGGGGGGGSGNTAGSDAGDAGGAGGSDAQPMCGDQIVNGNEECDDGNSDGLDGCGNDCRFNCLPGSTTRGCDDGNPCNGAESCSASNACESGTPPADGTDCGNGQICSNGICILPSCGDGQIQAPAEECDDGNAQPGDGCEPDCTYTCLASDSARDCSQNDECTGRNTCSDTTHTCEGTSLANGAACNGGSGYCASGVCTTPVCGNQRAEPGEDCDDGNTNDLDGCKADCTFTCTSASDCSDGSSCTLDECDTTAHTCSNPADTSQNGVACTVGTISGQCDAGSCVPAGCGDGTVQSGEQCDNGTNGNGPGTGCTFSCLYECDVTADCDDANPCNGSETCETVAGGQTCQAGTAMSPGDECVASPRRICDANLNCNLSLCGDGAVDTVAGEECEPPNTPSCDASCKTIAGVVCGDGTISGTEQCDDGNTDNLDGCSSVCLYETFMRMNTVTIQRGARPSWCTPNTNNQFGAALTDTAVNQLNIGLRNSLEAGNTNILIQMIGLDDLTAVADDSLSLGIATGIPDPAKGTWQTDPLDWWFLLDAAGVDSAGQPTDRLPGNIAARQLRAGPGSVSVELLFGPNLTKLDILEARMRGNTGAATSDPSAGSGGLPTGGLAAGLSVFEELFANQAGQGLCGSVTVESLAESPVPVELTSGLSACSASCPNSRTYTACPAGQPVNSGCNSLLDVVIGGCQVQPLLVCVPVINITQPDVDNGSTTPLSLGSDGKVPRSQTVGNQNAYTAYFQFTAKRQHATGTQ